MTPTEQLEKAQELVEAYKKLDVPDGYTYPVIFLFVRAMHIKWTLKVTTNHEN